jgi:hypothetical protein
MASSRRAARSATQASESRAQELDKSLREIRQRIEELSARQTNTVRRQLASLLQADPEDDEITFSTGLSVETPREVRDSVGHGGRRERESIADRVLGADRAAENVRDDRAPESSQATMDRLLPKDRVRTTNRVPTASDRVQRMNRAPSDVGDERAPVSTQPTMGRVPREDRVRGIDRAPRDVSDNRAPVPSTQATTDRASQLDRVRGTDRAPRNVSDDHALISTQATTDRTSPGIIGSGLGDGNQPSHQRDTEAATSKSRPAEASSLGNDQQKPGKDGHTFTVGGKRALATNKFHVYDGSSSLETFLAKFENCAEYYGWDRRERLCHLKSSLDGHARFRVELKGRRRKINESIQSVYQDVKRLMSLGYPGQSGALYELITRDAFLDCLNDSSLRIRVLEKEPQTVDEALAIVCRLEAYSSVDNVERSEEDYGRRRVRAVNIEQPARRTSTDDNRVQQLEKAVAEQKNEIQKLRAEAEEWRPKQQQRVTLASAAPVWSQQWYPAAAATQVMSPNGWPSDLVSSLPNSASASVNAAKQPTFQPANNGLNNSQPQHQWQQQRNRGQGRARGACRTCGQHGHWAQSRMSESTQRSAVDYRSQRQFATKHSGQRRWCQCVVTTI